MGVLGLSDALEVPLLAAGVPSETSVLDIESVSTRRRCGTSGGSRADSGAGLRG